MSWQYFGDVNLEHGGSFIDLDTWSDGYCSAVRVSDLDSGCGFTGAVMIEHVVINGTDDSARIRRAMRSCGCVSGWRTSRVPTGPEERRLWQACRLRSGDQLPRNIYADWLEEHGQAKLATEYRKPDEHAEHVKMALRHQIAEALLSYGDYDMDEHADNATEIIQMEPDGPMRFDEWEADLRLRGGDLRGYVESVHLR